MKRNHPEIPFARFADDIVAHCKSERQARWPSVNTSKAAIRDRLKGGHRESFRPVMG